METNLDYYRDVVVEFLRDYIEDRVNEAQYLGVQVSAQPETDEQLLNTVMGYSGMRSLTAARVCCNGSSACRGRRSTTSRRRFGWAVSET